MAVFGYVRVSSVEQNETRQLLAMREAGVARADIYIDRQSGKDFARPAYRALIERLTPEDTLFIQSIDRLGRDYDEIQKQWRVLTRTIGADIVVLDMPLLDTRRDKDLMGTFIADLVLQILSFVAHSERESIHRRQAEGIVAAKYRGVRFGRPEKELPLDFEKLVRQWENKEIATDKMLQTCNMSIATFYRRLKEHRVFISK
jgi:DNA invertase Pin-like site-specific DNA recombinase